MPRILVPGESFREFLCFSFNSRLAATPLATGERTKASETLEWDSSPRGSQEDPKQKDSTDIHGAFIGALGYQIEVVVVVAMESEFRIVGKSSHFLKCSCCRPTIVMVFVETDNIAGDKVK